LFFDTEDEGDMFLRNARWLSTDYTALSPRGYMLHNLHSSPYINSVMRSRRIRWGVHVARTGSIKNVYNNFRRKTSWERGHVEDLGVD
jgi:hypothetical protein